MYARLLGIVRSWIHGKDNIFTVFSKSNIRPYQTCFNIVLLVCIFVLQNYRKMANNENYEPMQVDAAEENDNDGDIGAAFHQQAEGGLGAANGFHGVGGFIAPGVIPPGNYPRGDVYGEDTRVCYNIENPSIDLEAYALGYTGLAAIYRLRFIAHHCPMLKVYVFVLLLLFLPFRPRYLVFL